MYSIEKAKVIKGKVILPEGSLVNIADYTVHSILYSSKVSNDGSFQLLVPDSTTEEILLVTNSNSQLY